MGGRLGTGWGGVMSVCVVSLYLSVTDISNPDLLACGSRTWFSLDIARFYEEHCQPSSGSTWLACPKTVIRPTLLGVGGVDTICTGFARLL